MEKVSDWLQNFLDRIEKTKFVKGPDTNFAFVKFLLINSLIPIFTRLIISFVFCIITISYEIKNEDVTELKVRMDIIPVSIAIAQAAKESGWGLSLIHI